MNYQNCNYIIKNPTYMFNKKTSSAFLNIPDSVHIIFISDLDHYWTKLASNRTNLTHLGCWVKIHWKLMISTVTEFSCLLLIWPTFMPKYDNPGLYNIISKWSNSHVTGLKATHLVNPVSVLCEAKPTCITMYPRFPSSLNQGCQI